MGLLDILKAIPLAAGEKARSDEFGPDYRQRWQKYQDEHVRSELQNAISGTEQRSKALAESARIRAAMMGKPEGTSPEEALAGNLAEDRTLGIEKERAGIGLTQAQTGYANARPDLEQAKIDLSRQLGEARNEVEREKVKAMMARVEGMLLGQGNRPEAGQYTWMMGPDGKMHYVNPKGNEGQGREFTLGGDPVSPRPTGTQVTGIQDAHTSLKKVRELKSLYKPEYVGPIAGRVQGLAQKLPESMSNALGMGVTPESAKFRAANQTIKNEVIKFITGAQMGVQEADRILRQVPTESDPPTVWNAKTDLLIENMQTFLANRTNLGQFAPDASGGAAAAPTVPMTTPAKRKAAPPGAVGYNKATNQYILSDGTIVPGEP